MADVASAAGLVERDQELAQLGSIIDEAAAGQGQVALIEGSAGIGKTSLLRAAADLATASGFTALRARASDLEREFAYGCVRQLLEPVVVRADGEREHLFGGAAALSQPLFFDFGDIVEPPSSSFPMLHGLYWLLNNLADRGPILLSVDDLHWADAESLRFFAYLAPRLDGLELAVLGSLRTGSALDADLARLARAPETTVLRPAALTPAGTATLCERHLGTAVTDAFSRACRDATGGNPFFLEALLREAGDQRLAPDGSGAARVRSIGPDAVTQSLLLHLSEAPPGAIALVRALAILGDGATVAEAAELAGIADAEASGAADLLAALNVVNAGDDLSFVHPILRESVYADVGFNERAEAHARAAVMLARRGASGERIAAQLVAAEPTGDANRVTLLRSVADDALARGAPAAAAAWLTRALAEPPAPEDLGEVLLDLGIAEHRLGSRQAVGHLSSAADLIEDPVQYGRCIRWVAMAHTQSGDADSAVRAIESAIERVEPHDREQALRLEAELTYHARYATTRATRPPRTGVTGASPGERLLLVNLACERARDAESAGESRRLLEDALAHWSDPGEWDLTSGQAFYDLVIGLLAADAFDHATGLVTRASEHATAQASIPDMAYAICWRGWVSMRAGAVAEAEADARTGLELLGNEGLPGRRFALALLVEALIEGGDAEAAERALSAGDLSEEVPPRRANTYLLGARALVHLARGRPREALERLLEFGRQDELWGAANPLASRWRSRASQAAAALGDRARAQQLAAEDLERARRWGTPTAVGIASRAVALVDDGPVVDALREAVGVLDRSPARLEHARTLLDLGAALRRANRRAEARGVLEPMIGVCDREGAGELARRARTEVLAAGGRSSDPEGIPIAQLTASERRVADLAAQGRTNPEIAQALFVTRKTVETHLGHVYAKLGITGRGQLRDALAD